MRIYAVNGSPRKNCNTATVLMKALEGAAAGGGPQTRTELLHLYAYAYKGCISCFECKRLGGRSYGKCAVKDELAPILEKLAGADAIIFGSPIYFSGITGMMRCFLERFLFQYFVYDQEYSSLAPKKMKTACIYTMNVPSAVMTEMQYPEQLKSMEFFIGKAFSAPSVLYVNDTYQFSDYSKYKVECFSEKDKARHRAEQFPVDCHKAYELGLNMARQIDDAQGLMQQRE